MTETRDEPEFIKGGARYWRRRINELLLFSRIDPWKLNDQKRAKVLDNLYHGLYGTRRNRAGHDDVFDGAVSSEGIAKAQNALRELIKDPGETVTVQLERQRLTFKMDRFGFFYGQRDSEDLSTMIFETLEHMLRAAFVSQSDFLTCSNPKCATPFLPLRKRDEGVAPYCSPKCGNLVLQRERRITMSKAKREAEKNKSHARYAARVRKNPGKKNVKIARRPRKPK